MLLCLITCVMVSNSVTRALSKNNRSVHEASSVPLKLTVQANGTRWAMATAATCMVAAAPLLPLLTFTATEPVKEATQGPAGCILYNPWALMACACVNVGSQASFNRIFFTS